MMHYIINVGKKIYILKSTISFLKAVVNFNWWLRARKAEHLFHL